MGIELLKVTPLSSFLLIWPSLFFLFLQEPFIQKNAKWVEELELMLRTGEKAEIQALSSFGFQYITQEFLPRKLREGDWI
jgi:hypothetical protein